jgi:hypothetical protein
MNPYFFICSWIEINGILGGRTIPNKNIFIMTPKLKLPKGMNWKRFEQEMENRGRSRATIRKYKYYASLVNSININNTDEVNNWFIETKHKRSVKAGVSAMVRSYYHFMGLKKEQINSVYFKSKQNKFYITRNELNILIEAIDDN